MTYTEKLLDPRWQKKRLQVLERDNFTCQLCKDTDTTLHVHHEKYNKEPWDAPDNTLTSLCKHCHTIKEFVKLTNLKENWKVASVEKRKLANGNVSATSYLTYNENSFCVLIGYIENGKFIFGANLYDIDLEWMLSKIEMVKSEMY